MDEKTILLMIEEILAPLYSTEKMGPGHDIHHVRRMVKIAEKICDPGHHLFLLKVAIWFHNLDRAERNLEKLSLLAGFSEAFSREEARLIIRAVEKHSCPNQSDDSQLLQDLKDCDRLDTGLILVLRVGYRNVPSYIPSDFEIWPDTSMRDRNIPSHLRDLIYCLEWEKMLRNPRAIEFGRSRFEQLRRFITDLKTELLELGEPSEL